ncbi:MAG TPA: hypothetical protein VGC62_03985 [Pseudomonas sp.]|uniref:hypothetical protein n=1 Tax=Pseudomonas sp. TaxID=306 RepID=UPI002EDAA530
MIIGNSAIHHIVSKAVAHTNLDTSDKDAYANAAAPTTPVVPVSGSNDASAQSGTDDKQSFDEAFAKLMVNLKAATASTTEEATDPQAAVSAMMAGADKQLASNDSVASGSSDSASSDPLAVSSDQSATSQDVGSVKDQFLSYMNQTDAEKARQQLTGVSKEEYDAMTPEQKAAVEKKVAELTKENVEVAQQQVKAKIAMAKAEMA